MELRVTNSYYSSPNSKRANSAFGRSTKADVCEDFDINPTPASKQLMRKLGLLFRKTPSGIQILYDRARTESLIEYLRQCGAQRTKQLKQWEAKQDKEGTNWKIQPSPDPFWSRLSFTLALNNPDFVNFTRIPINNGPCNANFYFTNQRAHILSATPSIPTTAGEGELGQVLLNQDRFVRAISSGKKKNYMRVVPPSFAAPVPLSVNEVQVLDISGFPVTDAYRWHLNAMRMLIASDEIFLDFSGLPEDTYTICWTGNRQQVIYATPSPVPLAFIDLLFSNPSGEDPPGVPISSSLAQLPASGNVVAASRSAAADQQGVYPVRNLADSKCRIEPVNYQLAFTSRKTTWIYLVIQQPSDRFHKLEILPHGSFKNRGPIVLERGVVAEGFESVNELPFQQFPKEKFKLVGQRKHDTEKIPIVDPLPVPTYQQIYPSPFPGPAHSFSQEVWKKEYSRNYVYV